MHPNSFTDNLACHPGCFCDNATARGFSTVSSPFHLLVSFAFFPSSLSHFDANTRLPHLVNVDEDPFRHNRFVYLLKKRVTVFGPQGDVQPMSLR